MIEPGLRKTVAVPTNAFYHRSAAEMTPTVVSQMRTHTEHLLE
ncbi:MAG: hypothetical protein M0Z88_10365 [Actinomycetota bacterium]|nr:hypothetical protein [Actinomycetota bacterium]